MEYFVFWHNNLDEFTFKVNEYLNEGWIPQGGVSVISDALGIRYYQSFVKIK